MKYEGVNQRGFERDVRLLLEYAQECGWDQDGNPCFEEEVHKLADDFGIGHSEIWDMLPEYAAQE